MTLVNLDFFFFQFVCLKSRFTSGVLKDMQITIRHIVHSRSLQDGLASYMFI